MMLSKCYTQYVSKFWKLSSGHRTRKGPFSFQYQRKVKVKSLSHVRLFATSWTVAYQAPPSMGFSTQEYWSGLPLPSPGDLLWPKDWTWVFCIPGRDLAPEVSEEEPLPSWQPRIFVQEPFWQTGGTYRPGLRAVFFNALNEICQISRKANYIFF